jgi:hypothetical protein
MSSFRGDNVPLITPRGGRRALLHGGCGSLKDNYGLNVTLSVTSAGRIRAWFYSMALAV